MSVQQQFPSSIPLESPPMDGQPERTTARTRRPSARAHGRMSTSGWPEELEAQDLYWGAVLGALLGFGLAIAGILVAVGARGMAGETAAFWYLSRSAGLVSYLLLWGATVWGLLLSTRLLRSLARPAVLLDVHQYLASLAVGFALFHGLVLLGDRYVSFTLGQVLLPFASSYEPVAVALGQWALWLSVLLIVSFYVRRQMGPKHWRRLHYASFLAYVLALGHAILAGTDTQHLGVSAGYVVTAGVVALLVGYRIWPPS